MKTKDNFHDTLGEQLKLDGMESAADIRRGQLRLARSLAVKIAQHNMNGLVNADQVGRALQEHGIESLGPAAGSIFKTDEFKFTGEFVKSRRVSNHSRLLRVWRYVGTSL